MKHKDWILHLHQVTKEEKQSVLELLLAERSVARGKRRRFFSPSAVHKEDQSKQARLRLLNAIQVGAGTGKEDAAMEGEQTIEEVDQMIAELFEYVGFKESYLAELALLDPDTRREKQLLKLGEIFIKVAECNAAEFAEKYLEAGFPVNFQLPRTGQTALHTAAARTATTFADVLMDSGRCDYLLRDARGLLAADAAYYCGYCSSITNDLRILTEQQAAERGVTVKLYQSDHLFRPGLSRG